MIVLLGILSGDFKEAIKAFWIPFVYLIVMFFITRAAARNRATRFVMLVIKNDVQCESKTNSKII